MAGNAVTDMALEEDQLPTPVLKYSLDVNALNFCRFSLAPKGEGEALIAVPNLVESSLVDVWTLPTCQRLHAAIGKQPGSLVQDPWDTTATGNPRTGSIMALHLFIAPHPSRNSVTQLRVVTGYENGGVCLWARVDSEPERSIEGRGWVALWQVKAHADSVMALAVSPRPDYVVSVSADNLLARFRLEDDNSNGDNPERLSIHRTKHPGNAAVTFRDDGRVCAVAGWDGRIRLYSIKTFKPLGTLQYHKGTAQAVAFAHPDPSPREDEDVRDDREKRSRWLVCGGVDKRMSLWELMSFERPAAQ